MSTASTLVDLRKERVALTDRMAQITTGCAESRRSFSDAEEAEFNKADAEQAKLKILIDRLEKTDEIGSQLRSVRTIGPGTEDKLIETKLVKPEEQQIHAWRSYLRHGEQGMDTAQLSALRALNAVDGANGGYIAPATPSNEFIKLLRDTTSILSAPVRFMPTNSGNDLPFPIVDDTGNTGEVSPAPSGYIPDSGSDPTFGQATLKAYAYDSEVVRISKMLLQDSVIPVEQLINELLAERINHKINGALTTGSGSGAPQGIVTGAGTSSVQLPATTIGATGAVAYQNIQAIIHSVAPQHRKSPAFGLMMNDNTLLKYKQLVDGQNRPLWTASMAAGTPDLICGVPYYINPDLADVATGAKSIVVGDFKKFFVRMVNQIEFVRMSELYARYLQIGFLAWVRVDGRVMDNTAIKAVAHA